MSTTATALSPIKPARHDRTVRFFQTVPLADSRTTGKDGATRSALGFCLTQADLTFLFRGTPYRPWALSSGANRMLART